MTVRLTDGRTLERSVRGARGYPEHAASPAELDEKFLGVRAAHGSPPGRLLRPWTSCAPWKRRRPCADSPRGLRWARRRRSRSEETDGRPVPCPAQPFVRPRGAARPLSQGACHGSRCRLHRPGGRCRLRREGRGGATRRWRCSSPERRCAPRSAFASTIPRPTSAGATSRVLRRSGIRPDALMLPKCDGPEEIREVAAALAADLPDLPLIVMLETARGVGRGRGDCDRHSDGLRRLLRSHRLCRRRRLRGGLGTLRSMRARGRIVAAAVARVGALDSPYMDVPALAALAAESPPYARPRLHREGRHPPDPGPGHPGGVLSRRRRGRLGAAHRRRLRTERRWRAARRRAS